MDLGMQSRKFKIIQFIMVIIFLFMFVGPLFLSEPLFDKIFIHRFIPDWSFMEPILQFFVRHSWLIRIPVSFAGFVGVCLMGIIFFGGGENLRKQ